MPTKLKNLKVKRVALVDEGANPEAYVRFAKAKTEQPEPEGEDEQGVIKRALAAIARALGIEPVEKAAHTFAEGEAVGDYERIMDGEIYPMIWAFIDSVRSILTDTQKKDGEKEALMSQSLTEFSEAFSKGISSWAAGAASGMEVQKSGDLLEKMRGQLDELIAKGCKKPVEKETGPEEGPGEDGGSEPPIRKGAIDMKFDTEKMTPEERAVYEDLAKRYGQDGGETTPPPAPSNPVPQSDPEPGLGSDGDIYKGLHPEVKAELENLRKFREESEMREYTEVAKKYTLLGKKPEELAPVLKSLKAAGGSAYDDMISLLDSGLSIVEKSGVFGEIGKRGGMDMGGNAWGKIEAAAQEIIKAKPGMRWHEAVDQACIQHPELVQEYERSR